MTCFIYKITIKSVQKHKQVTTENHQRGDMAYLCCGVHAYTHTHTQKLILGFQWRKNALYGMTHTHTHVCRMA